MKLEAYYYFISTSLKTFTIQNNLAGALKRNVDGGIRIGNTKLNSYIHYQLCFTSQGEWHTMKQNFICIYSCFPFHLLPHRLHFQSDQLHILF